MARSTQSGTQSIERAVMLLKKLATRGNFGWRLVDLSKHCEFDKGTTHRILACLTREGLARQRKNDRHYVPGPLLFELGLSLPALAALQAVCSVPLTRVAKKLGGVSLFYLRSGTEFVCAARIGFAPLKALTIDVGTRRPMIVSAGGVAMLIALPKDEAKAVMARNMKEVARFGHARLRSLKRMIRRSESRGFGISLSDVVPGISAFGMAVRDNCGLPFGSISIVGPTENFPSARIPEITRILEEESQWISREAARIFGKADQAGV